MKIYNEDLIYHLLLNMDDIQKLAKSTDDDSIDSMLNIIQEWCEKTFGASNYSYKFVDDGYDDITDIFKFKSDKYRNMFIMKWL